MRTVMMIVLVVGCGSDDKGKGKDSGLPALTLEAGLGEDAFTDVADGTETMMVHGPQGGWHIDTAVRMCNVSGQLVQLLPRVTVESTGEVLAGSQETDIAYRELVLQDDHCGEIVGLRAFLDDFDANLDSIRALEGETFLIELEGTDVSNESLATDSFTVVVTLDPTDLVVDTGM
jgi:hypothetical protein